MKRIDFGKILERVQSIAFIVAAVMLTAYVGQRMFAAPGTLGGSTPELTPGQQLSMPGVNFARARQTLVFVISADCTFCTQSMPFYARLATQRSQLGGTQFVVWTADAAGRASGYLQAHAFSVDQVLEGQDRKTLPVTGTPTLLLLDGAGKLKQAWRGLLQPAQETEVVARLEEGVR
jgi:hypothetical protein